MQNGSCGKQETWSMLETCGFCEFWEGTEGVGLQLHFCPLNRKFIFKIEVHMQTVYFCSLNVFYIEMFVKINFGI